jgi:hypothetical protein
MARTTNGEWRVLTPVLVAALAAAFGCGKSDLYRNQPYDTGSDADADTDSDTDSDSDADTGTGDPQPNCPVNSGWPCSCDYISECDDGSICAGIVYLEDYGTSCFASCDNPEGPCPDTPYAAEEMCVIDGDSMGYYCALLCDSSSECPPDQVCADWDGEFSLCI